MICIKMNQAFAIPNKEMILGGGVGWGGGVECCLMIQWNEWDKKDHVSAQEQLS